MIYTLTKHRSSIIIPPPNTALLPSNNMTPDACIRVLSSIIPPPVLLINILVPSNIVGNLNDATALVSELPLVLSSSEVLFSK